MTYRLLCCLLFSCSFLFASDEPAVEAQRESLARLQEYVGQWRGVGLVRRGSRDGAWSETAGCAWDLSAKRAALQLTSPKAKYFTSMRFEALAKPGGYRMLGQRGDRQAVYQGQLGDDGTSLTLQIVKPQAELPDRLKIRLAAEGKRLVVLYEEKRGAASFARLAEVGFTRKGSGFGAGLSFVECVVTGGQGTIPVQFKGKTYYVCCSGCKEYFDDDPAKAMEEYKERRAKRKAEQAKK